MAARSRGPPRSRLRRERARRKSGACASARRNASRIGAASTRKSSESSRRLIAAGSVSGLASRSASRRAPAGVTVRSIVARSEPSRAPLKVRVSSRLARVAGSISRLVPRARRVGARERRPRLELGALDIGQRQRGGGDLGARERAEAVEGFDAVELADPAFRRRAVARFARERRRRQPHVGDDLGKQPLVVDRLRSDDLARLEARDLRGEARFVGLRQRERAGRKIKRREAVSVPPLARADLLHGDEQARAAGLQQPLLGDRARRDQPHDVALDDRFRSPLLGFRRVFELLADRDAMAERDEAVEIVVGALDRHAAHADVFALVLAPFGEDDAERPARDLRVVEEELVEIAHPVEEQAVGIGGLDLEILRHHRREARARRFRDFWAVAAGVHAPSLANRRSARASGRGSACPVGIDYDIYRGP